MVDWEPSMVGKVMKIDSNNMHEFDEYKDLKIIEVQKEKKKINLKKKRKNRSTIT